MFLAAALSQPPTTTMTYTDKGAISHAGTGSVVLDFFSRVTAREKGAATSDEEIQRLVRAAWGENPALTLLAIMHKRNCRGGAGERHVTSVALKTLPREQVLANMSCLPEYGCWRDLVDFFAGTEYETDALTLFVAQLRADRAKLTEALALTATSCADGSAVSPLSGLSLAAKWAPTEKCAYDRRAAKSAASTATAASPPASQLAHMLARADGVSFAEDHQQVMKYYRTHYLTPLRSALRVVERFLCAKEFDQ